MKIIITGGCGFLGSNLAEEVIKCGEELIIIDNLSRETSIKNYLWLKKQGEFLFKNIDIPWKNQHFRCLQLTPEPQASEGFQLGTPDTPERLLEIVGIPCVPCGPDLPAHHLDQDPSQGTIGN